LLLRQNFWLQQQKKIFVVPNFVAVTKTFFPVSPQRNIASNLLSLHESTPHLQKEPHKRQTLSNADEAFSSEYCALLINSGKIYALRRFLLESKKKNVLNKIKTVDIFRLF